MISITQHLVEENELVYYDMTHTVSKLPILAYVVKLYQPNVT